MHICNYVKTLTNLSVQRPIHNTLAEDTQSNGRDNFHRPKFRLGLNAEHFYSHLLGISVLHDQFCVSSRQIRRAGSVQEGPSAVGTERMPVLLCMRREVRIVLTGTAQMVFTTAVI